MATTARVLHAACLEARHAHLWQPAAVLLLPTLVLQLAFPWWLRTRLSPSMWTVVAGSLLIAWLTHAAAAASWGWVAANRRQRPVSRRSLAAAALRVGTAVTIGLLAGVVPGLWLQARLARLPVEAAAGTPLASDSGTRGLLMALAGCSLLLSVLGQSLAAALAEALGTIVPVATVDGRVQFSLNYGPHLVTSVLAYAWTVFAVTLQAIGVSLTLTAAPVAATPARPKPMRSLPTRVAVVGLVLVLLVGAVAAVGKVQQHL